MYISLPLTFTYLSKRNASTPPVSTTKALDTKLHYRNIHLGHQANDSCEQTRKAFTLCREGVLFLETKFAGLLDIYTIVVSICVSAIARGKDYLSIETCMQQSEHMRAWMLKQERERWIETEANLVFVSGRQASKDQQHVWRLFFRYDIILVGSWCSSALLFSNTHTFDVSGCSVFILVYCTQTTVLLYA